MAIVQFKYGNGALPSVKNSGALYLNQYNKKIYVDLDESNRVCIGDFQKVNWASSSTITSPGNALKALTVKDNNILYLTYDLTTGHSALWYYDDSNSQNAQFREIISSESISIIASEFDRIDEELTDLNSELENLASVVNTKVNKEELEGYNFATEDEVAAFAIAAISNVQGNAASDTAEILTIQGTRKYIDSKVQEVNGRIDTLEQNIGNLSNIMNFLGVLTIDLNHEATTNPITINGKSHTAVAGDVVIDNAGEEFVFDGSKWQQIGNITAETAAINNLQTRMTTAESNITDLQGRMTTGEGNITNLQGRMTTAESNLQTINTTIGTKLTHSTDTLWGVLTWGTW